MKVAQSAVRALAPVVSALDTTIVVGTRAVAKTAGDLDREGEAAVRSVFNIGPKPERSIKMNGRGRRPDGLNDASVSEVKNAAYQSLTQQLRDYIDFAQQSGRSFDLYTRPDTVLSGPLQDAIRSGSVIHMTIP